MPAYMNNEPSATQPPRARRRWLRVIIVVLALFGLCISALPYGIGYGLQWWLKKQGATEARVADVDFNPFTGRLVIRGLRSNAGEAGAVELREAYLRLAWRPLWHKRVYLEEIALSDGMISGERLDDGGWRVAGLVFPGGAATTPAWGLGIGRLHITKLRLDYRGPGPRTALDIEQVQLTNLASWDAKLDTHLIFQGQLNDSALRIDAKLKPFAAAPELSGRIELAGLALAPFAELAAPQLTNLEGNLRIKVAVEARHSGDAGLRLTQQGDITLEQIQLQDRDSEVSGERLSWDGDLDLTVPRDARHAQLSATGKLESGGLSLRVPRDDLALRHGGMAWDGSFHYGKPGPDHVILDGGLKVQDLHIEQPEKRLGVLALADADLQGISADGTRHLGLSQARFQQLRLGERLGETAQPALFDAAVATVQSLGVSELHDIAIDTIELERANALLRRDPHGRWHLLEDMLALRSGKPAPGDTATPASVRITSVQVRGDSQLRYEDETVTPPYRTALRISDARLTGLDSDPAAQPAALTVTGKIGEYSDLALNGTIQPFAPRLTLDLSGTIKALELPQLSSYTAQSLGYNLTSGQMDAEVALQIEQGELKGASKLVINKLEVAPGDSKRMAELTTQLNMPLDSALSLLRDKDNNIRLKLPVSGDVADPKFDLGDAVNQAIGKAMRVTAVSYLKFYFQPFGALITIGKWAGEAAASVHLDPVAFEAGGAALDGTADQYLDRLAGLMQERPKLRIKLCGRAVPADRDALAQAAVLVTSGKSPQEIDDLVRIDDTQVIASLDTLDNVSYLGMVNVHGADGFRLENSVLDSNTDSDDTLQVATYRFVPISSPFLLSSFLIGKYH